jgi:polysaccharide export outer membrane protein
MFIADEDFMYQDLTDSLPQQIRMGIGDRISVQILTNDGYTMLTPGLTSPEGGFNRGPNEFDVDQLGYIRLPFIDTLYVLGKTQREVEHSIEQAFEAYFIEPFAQIEVLNRRAYVFPAGGEGVVISLSSENITLIEVLAQAGGIPPTGKAYEIRLIRATVDGQHLVSRIDLRDINSLSQIGTFIHHGDVVYVDPIFQPTLLTQITPFFTVIASVASVLALVRVLNQ